MPDTTDYPYIRWWGKSIMGSDDHYIVLEIQQAKRDGAPQTALYPRFSASGAGGSSWFTIDMLTNPSTITRFIARFGFDPTSVKEGSHA
jgi:hypothetical protein